MSSHAAPLKTEDSVLIENIRSGKTNFFAELVKRYEGLVRTSIWNLIRDSELMEDLVQEIFAKAYAKLGMLEKACHFKVWLLQIARRHCLDHLRKKKIPVEDLDAMEAKGQLPVVAEAFIPIKDSMMITMLEHLSPLDAELLWLRFVESVSYRDLSTITGLQESALRKRISRGLSRLREMLT